MPGAKKKYLVDLEAEEEALAEEAALDELVTAELASAAVTDGLSDPSGTTQGGWIVGQQTFDVVNVDPNTGAVASVSDGNAFTGGSIVQPYTGEGQNSAAASPSYVGAGTVDKPTAIYDNNGNVVAWQYVDNMGNKVFQPVDEYEGSETIQFSDDALTAPRPTPNSVPSTPTAQFPQLTPDALAQLNAAIQEAVGPYDPNFLNTGPPENISDVLSGTEWMSLLGNPENRSPGPVNDNQPSTISQILSGTYADSVLQMQLSSEGLVPGSFVSPTIPNDYLFNPNATSLVEAILLSSRSPNAQLLQAQSLQLGASMAPIIGSVSTWLNPHSGWFAKGLAVAGVLPIVSDLAGLGAVAELGSLSAEVDAVLVEDVAQTQEIQDLLQEAEEADLQVSAKGPASWTARQIEAAIRYQEVYNETLDPKKAGDAFHEAVGAASGGTTGPDRLSFGLVHEIKTSLGPPDTRIFINALNQAESQVPGQPTVVTVEFATPAWPTSIITTGPPG